jgi:alpha-galactosidase
VCDTLLISIAACACVLQVDAVKANLPIYNSQYHARDAIRMDKNCTWDPATIGTNAPSAAASAWYESLASGFLEQGVDFVKADCMWPGSPGGMPFDEDVTAFSEAFARVAPAIVISWSPGDGMTVGNGTFVASHGGKWGVMYRVTSDFHESWPALAHHLDVATEFASLVNANDTYPDLDMLSLGRQAPDGHPTAFTHDEQRTLMTLWAVFRAPLIIGARLPLDADDDWTLSLLTNAAVLAVNNGTHGNRPVNPVLPPGQNGAALYAWLAEYDDAPGRSAVALFNARDSSATVGVAVPGGGCAVNLWTGKNEGALPVNGVLSRTLPSHGAGLWSVASC